MKTLPPIHAHAETVAQAVIRHAAEGLAAWHRGIGLDDLLDDLPPQAPRRAIASLLFAVFRQRARTDALLDRLAPRADAELRPILVAALTQALTQHGIAAPVAVDVAVSHARQRRGRGAAGFVNAVLRRSLEAAAAQPPADALDLLPPAVARRWRANLGPGTTAALAELFQQEAPLTFRILRPSLPGDAFDAVGAVPLDLPAWAGDECFMACSRPAELLAGPWLAHGDIYVQDPSTVAAPRLLPDPLDGLVLDLCAAPGGKALLLAGRLAHDGLLVAADLSCRRQRRTVANLAAAPFSRAFAIAADACRPPFPPACANHVLLDVPCTNTGVFRRRPDALWRFGQGHLDELTARQRNLLAAAARLVRPGGNLVYSTCSLEPEENAAQVDAFLAAHPDFARQRQETILPVPGHDGGFACLMTRVDRR
jgi:16S rRNA (cytosine967-C5)-methyltransferase